MAKIKIGNVRTPVEYLKQFFAPVGYGLGSFGVGTSDLDTNTKSGCYSFTDGCKNTPCSYGVALVLNRYDVDIVQIVFNVSMKSGYEGGSIARRVYVEDEWSEWEYFNPPTQPGIEYRTTERWQGKVVYTKLFDFGLSANGASIAHNINPNTIIRYSAVAGSIPLPHFNTAEPEYQITVSVGATDITMACGTSRIGLKTYVQLWYIKD